MKRVTQGRNIVLLSLLNVTALLSLFGTSWVFDYFSFSGAPVPALHGSSQLILVTGESWSSSNGTLRRFERERPEIPWQPVGDALPVAMGANGFAWGVGLHSQNGLPGPHLDEGDRCTPAGIFLITSLFGHLPVETLGHLHLPYRQLTSDDVCVDDPASAFYNQIISRAAIKSPDWRSAEPMVAAGDTGYRLGVVFDQNPSPSRPRQGSCIFLHIGPDRGGTFGCTTLNEARLREIVDWLDVSKKPLMIQLPEPVFRQVRKSWGFGEIALVSD